MILSNETKRNITLFVSAFLLLGILHVSLYYVDFTHCITTVFGSALVVLWAITVQKRITDRRLRHLMLWIAATMLFHFVLQFIRYDLVEEISVASRYMWYLMYIPMTAQPVLILFLALFIHRPEGKSLSRAYIFIIAAGILLVLGVLTNDLHFWVWSFPDGTLIDNGQEENGWLFYLINIFIYGIYGAALFIIFIKNNRYVMRKYRWIAAVPLLIAAIYFGLYPLGIAKMFFPCHIWNMGEMAAFCVIATIEVCVQTGMIPANRGYEILFASVSFPAVIADNAGNPVYQTKETVYPFQNDWNVRIVSHPIQGGSIDYPVDIEKIQKLNKKLSEHLDQLETRNAYLAEEAHVMQESTEIQTRNQLYEQIAGIVKPQLECIENILSSADELTEKQLAQVAILKAYIKRRSNMELLGTEGTLETGELATAVAESLEYLNLYGLSTVSRYAGAHTHSVNTVTAAYENIETIIEDSLDTLSNMVITILSEEKKLTVRIMLTADNFSFDSQNFKQDTTDYSADVAISKEGPDMIIALTFTERGDML